MHRKNNIQIPTPVQWKPETKEQNLEWSDFRFLFFSGKDLNLKLEDNCMFSVMSSEVMYNEWTKTEAECTEEVLHG